MFSIQKFIIQILFGYCLTEQKVYRFLSTTAILNALKQPAELNILHYINKSLMKILQLQQSWKQLRILLIPYYRVQHKLKIQDDQNYIGHIFVNDFNRLKTCSFAIQNSRNYLQQKSNSFELSSLDINQSIPIPYLEIKIIQNYHICKTF
ncbi:unnamed protein product (macronuclear) [Paramecium tetraurelia]|uniref:Transmembrane protein n=1 Tax=Paramecium tetraurelia TaxID=5888 RepID=A0CFY3_PARTE|nr:uncharacterized protein GSPATT00038142001 [Paramecium tetraurelia]CAK69700.1 unnamed protein product [Paramecium tetraurelia]|eukprot:XP_001437097.1 hypothetical protein (macronuclear) [Paramecium tetraurelia strain d4-2]